MLDFDPGRPGCRSIGVFDIGKTQINSYLKKNEAKLKSKDIDKDTVSKELKSWQRLCRITPDEDKFEKVNFLKNEKLGPCDYVY